MKNNNFNNYLILETKIGKGTFATVDFRTDEIIGVLIGEVLPLPTRFTVQVTEKEHVVPNFGKYMNHSCQPNCYLNLSDRTFRALNPIPKGQELTFDYNSTETELAAPFDCQCGAIDCCQQVLGSKFLKVYKNISRE